jgi:MFS family permease
VAGDGNGELLMPERWCARRESLLAGACLIGLGLIWMAVADSWSRGIIGFALAGSGNGVINIALSAAIWADVPAASQRAAWSAFNCMLAFMLIIGFSVGSAVSPDVAPQVVFVGGAFSLAATAVYAASRVSGRGRLALNQG